VLVYHLPELRHHHTAYVRWNASRGNFTIWKRRWFYSTKPANQTYPNLIRFKRSLQLSKCLLACINLTKSSLAQKKLARLGIEREPKDTLCGIWQSLGLYTNTYVRVPCFCWRLIGEPRAWPHKHRRLRSVRKAWDQRRSWVRYHADIVLRAWL
jgi:hypothetical protein